MSLSDQATPGPPSADPARAGQALARLMKLIARLRAPDGCPWDRQQTPASVVAYLLEEAYEAAEAVEQARPAEVAAELGDLLFQVAFMAQLFAEQGHFDLVQAIDLVEAKMRRRHPHVFGQAEQAGSAEEVRALWGQIKSQERAQAGQAQEGLLASVPQASPALTRAQRLGQRAGRVGFDWPGAPEVWLKVGEELDELRQAPPPEEEAELGDLFFALAQWARHRGLNAEAALRRANARFVRRFAAMEELARQRSLHLEALSPQAWDELWEEVKAQEPPPAQGA